MAQIRPAARLLKTIGRDLIKDHYAAIVELVKNSYDADSESVDIYFEYDKKKQVLSIRVEDFGHGMSYDTVLNKWLVPATNDKLTRKRSDKGRVLQGRKGIGRFAAAILGDLIYVETTQNKNTSALLLDMEKLDKTVFLEDFEIDIETSKSNKENGTIIEVEKLGVDEKAVVELWNKNQIKKLFIELRSLISPTEIFESAKQAGYEVQFDEFTITLHFKNFPNEQFSNGEYKLKPFPVTDLYDYRLWGTVDEFGIAELNYFNQNIPAVQKEKINVNLSLLTDEKISFPGKVYVDLRGFDRDPESIENLIKRGLKDPDTGNYVGKLDARRLLNEIYGVGVYRQQFRVRPYGDQSFDWLDLDKKRVQNPSFRIGHDQVIGFVFIQSEDVSNLVEKSARDGLVENSAYEGLKYAVSKAINELEARRRVYREKTLKGRKKRNIEGDVDSLFDFEGIKSTLNKELLKLNVSPEARKSIGKAIDDVIESEKRQKTAYSEKIKETIAMYQSHATLGKLTHVLIHEGRKHIKDLKETVPRIVKWAKKLANGPDEETEIKLNDRGEQVKSSAEALSYLFKKIEPLARPRRSSNKNLDLKKSIEASLDIFSSDFESNNVEIRIKTDGNYVIHANELDIHTIFTNLVENSVYWIKAQKTDSNFIELEMEEKEGIISVLYRDSGPGFQGSDLDLMFEPGYSNKPEGTGLGLALAGDAALRNDITIKAVKVESGAEFVLTFKAVNDD